MGAHSVQPRSRKLVAGNTITEKAVNFNLATKPFFCIAKDDSRRAQIAAPENVQEKESELLEKLLDKLSHMKSIKKRASKTLHGIEMLMVLDHEIYNMYVLSPFNCLLSQIR